MSTMSTGVMITKLQRKLGLPISDGIDFLNEAFQKVNLSSKGGFIWQLQTTTLTTPASDAEITLPTDFDPGKTAVLRGNTNPIAGSPTVTKTIIPYKTMAEFANEAHFETSGGGFFSAWTFYPGIHTLSPPPIFKMRLGPREAFNGQQYVLDFWYHSTVIGPFPADNFTWFPTPDALNFVIMDFAEAEIRDVYRLSGGDKKREDALQAMASVIDSYRTDRYSLAGLTELVMDSQEKQAEKDK